MIKKSVTLEIETAHCTISPLTDKQYYKLAKKGLPLFEDYDCMMGLEQVLEYHHPEFTPPHMYVALKTLFWETEDGYDDYKCSFQYPFSVVIKKKDNPENTFQYTFKLMDMKGGLSVNYRRIIKDKTELKKYDIDVLHEPFEDEFPKSEMCSLTRTFVFYLVGFMKSFGPRYDEEFFRSNDSCFMVYGYVGKNFFTRYYDTEGQYRRRIVELKKRNIPYNTVRRHE